MRDKSIDCLSIEVLGHILGELDDDDLVSASSVCRHWFDVINIYLLRRKQWAILRPEADDFVPDWLLKDLTLMNLGSEQFVKIKGICAHLNSLHIGYDRVQDPGLNETMVEFLNGCYNLQQISFKNIIPSDSMLQAVLERGINTIHSLSFECCSSRLTAEHVEEILERCHFPETRIIVRRSNEESERHLIANYPFNSVARLHVPAGISVLKVDCSGLTEDAYGCLKFCYGLRSISLNNCFRIEDEAVISLTKLSLLSELSFTGANKVTAEGWAAVFRSASIMDLSLIRCTTGLSDVVFLDATAGRRRLHLDLHGCKCVTERGLSLLLRTSQRISLALDYDRRLLNRVASRVILGQAPRLRFLQLVIQRVGSTTIEASRHLKQIKRSLLKHSKRHHMRFCYKELFTKSDAVS